VIHYFYRPNKDTDYYEVSVDRARELRLRMASEDPFDSTDTPFIRGESDMSGGIVRANGEGILTIRPAEHLLGGFLSDTTAHDFGTYADMLAPALDEIAAAIPSALAMILGRLLGQAFSVSRDVRWPNDDENIERAMFYGSGRHFNKDNPQEWGKYEPKILKA